MAVRSRLGSRSPTAFEIEGMTQLQAAAQGERADDVGRLETGIH